MTNIQTPHTHLCRFPGSAHRNCIPPCTWCPGAYSCPMTWAILWGLQLDNDMGYTLGPTTGQWQEPCSGAYSWPVTWAMLWGLQLASDMGYTLGPTAGQWQELYSGVYSWPLTGAMFWGLQPTSDAWNAAFSLAGEGKPPQSRCYSHSCRRQVCRLQPGVGRQHVAPPGAGGRAAPQPEPGDWMCGSGAACWTWAGPASPPLRPLPQLWAGCSARWPATLGWSAPPPQHCWPAQQQRHLRSCSMARTMTSCRQTALTISSEWSPHAINLTSTHYLPRLPPSHHCFPHQMNFSVQNTLHTWNSSQNEELLVKHTAWAVKN